VEYRDADFLHALGLPQHIDSLSRFWPNRGPCWDALARIEDEQGNPIGCILVEAKSHVPEFYSNDTRAGANSIQLIKKSLGGAKNWFDVEEAIVWTGFPNPDKCLYQYTNRLAHLYFFREILGLPAFLVNVHFVGDHPLSTLLRVKQVPLHRGLNPCTFCATGAMLMNIPLESLSGLIPRRLRRGLNGLG
jgi:hypothetical protein